MSTKALVEAIAALVIFLTLAGLGLFKVPSEEPTVEAGLRVQAVAVLTDLANPVDLTVKGRVISVSGEVQSQSERRKIEAGLRAITGVEEVRAQLVVLPLVERFVFDLRKEADSLTLSGHVIREMTREALAGLGGADLAVEVVRGAPFPEWDRLVLDLAEAVQGLAEAQVTLEGAQGRLEGVALWPAEAEAVRARLADLPDGMQMAIDLTVLDDGAPFVLVAEQRLGLGVSLQGKLPPDLAPQALVDLFERVEDQALISGPVDPDLPALGPAMLGAAQVLAKAERGSVVVTPVAVVLTGLRGPAAMEAALARLETILPAGTQLVVSRLPDVDPEALWVRLDRIGGTVSAEGVIPRDLEPAGLADRLGQGSDVTRVRQIPYPDTSNWLASLNAVLDVFAEVLDGAILLEQDAVTLDALLPDPEVAEWVEAQLAALPQGQSFRRYVELVDDGLRLDAQLTYLPETGLDIAGTLPGDLSGVEAARVLGLDAFGGSPRTDKDTLLPRAAQILARIAPWLGEAERLSIGLTPDGIMIEAVLSPGVDLPQVQEAMQQALTPVDDIRLRLLEAYPEAGTERDNVALGARQVFLAGFWLPVLEFTPSVAECARQSVIAQQQTPVRFLSGASRLDARAIRGVNALSAVMRLCVIEGELTVTVEGHTDDRGGVAANQEISRLRAEVVTQEILKRGVPEAAVESVGLGPLRPVADNATPEGRALNRRISLAWEGGVEALE